MVAQDKVAEDVLRSPNWLINMDEATILTGMPTPEGTTGRLNAKTVPPGPHLGARPNKPKRVAKRPAAAEEEEPQKASRAEENAGS